MSLLIHNKNYTCQGFSIKTSVHVTVRHQSNKRSLIFTIMFFNLAQSISQQTRSLDVDYYTNHVVVQISLSTGSEFYLIVGRLVLLGTFFLHIICFGRNR